MHDTNHHHKDSLVGAGSLGDQNAGEDWRVALKPERPHDELSFEELAGRYNFQKTSGRANMFVRWEN